VGRLALVSSARVAEHESVGAVDRLATCLFGDPPPNDSAAVLRVRGAQLHMMGAPPLPGPWPLRCATLARALAEEERGRGEANDRGMLEAGESLAHALAASTVLSDDLSQPLLGLLRAARAGSHVLQRAPEIPGPPSAVQAETVDTLARSAMLPVGSVALSSIQLAPFFDDTALAFLVVDPRTDVASTCVYRDAGRRSIQCSRVHAPLGHRWHDDDLRLWGTSDAPLGGYLFVGDRGADGIIRVDTGEEAPVTLPHGVYGANARRDGGLDLVGIGHVAPEIRLFHVDGSRVVETPVLSRKEVGNPTYNVGLFWDFLVTKAFVADLPGLRLRVRDVKNGELGPVLDVGKVGKVSRIESGSEPHLEGCRSESMISLRVKGWDNEYVSFQVGKHWTAPVEASESNAGLFTCHRAESAVVDQTGHVEQSHYEPRVTENRCTPAGCQTNAIETREIWKESHELAPEGARDVVVAPLVQKALLVWRAGNDGGLRMRLAPLLELKKTADVVLLDDHIDRGERRVDSTLVAFAIRPVGSGVLLFLQTGLGVFIYLVDETGNLTAVPVE